MSILTILILAVIAIVLIGIACLVAGGGIICSGLTGKMATGAESMSPAGTVTGKALVVYDPGVTGAARKAATEIAGNLKARGYQVELAGVSGKTAANATGYDIVIVGGPCYFGKAANSIEAYLKGLKLDKNTKLGVFATTGTNNFVASDLASMEQQVSSLQGENRATIRMIGDRDANNATQSCRSLVAALG